MEMYSPLLGMSSDMSIETLEQTYYKLLEEYHNDSQLIDLVRDTYHYFLGEILNKKSDSINPSLFEDDIYNNQDYSEKRDDLTPDPDNNQESLIKHFEFTDEAKDIKAKPASNKSIIGGDPKRVNELMDIINGTTETKTANDNISDIPITQEKPKITAYIINFFYTLAIVAIVSFSGIIVFTAFEDFICGPGIIAGIIKKVIDYYINIVLTIYMFIFNMLHNIFSFIPNYNGLISGNSFLSTLAIKLVLFIIFNLLIVYIFKFGIKLLQDAEEDNDPYTKD